MIYTNPKTGATVESELTMDAAIAILDEDPKGSFGWDLAKKAKKFDMSPAQTFYIFKLAEERKNPTKKVSDGAMAIGKHEPYDRHPNIVEMLALAAKKAKKLPKIRLTIERADGSNFPVCLSLNGAKSKTPGGVAITDGAPYGSNVYYGGIRPDGSFFPTAKCSREIKEFLWAFNEDPAGIAAAYGHKHSNCMFCKKALDTKESTAVGYGPVCADNYGLPWGHVKEAK